MINSIISMLYVLCFRQNIWKMFVGLIKSFFYTSHAWRHGRSGKMCTLDWNWDSFGASPAAQDYDHEACRSHGEHRWGPQQRPGFHMPEPGESNPSGQGTLVPRGGSHWSYKTDWASVGGQTSWLHGHQWLACSTEAWSELDWSKAMTCFHLESIAAVM